MKRKVSRVEAAVIMKAARELRKVNHDETVDPIETVSESLIKVQPCEPVIVFETPVVKKNMFSKFVDVIRKWVS